MKFNEWIAKEVKSNEVEIEDFRKSIVALQFEVKKAHQQKRDLGRKNDENREQHDRIDERVTYIKSRIESLKSKINARKSSIANIKDFAKMKPIRLKTGAVVNSKIIDEMLNKLSGKYWTIEFTQYQDGLQIAYINTRTGSKGSFKVYLMAVISDSVELPLFEKGDVKECSIHS